MEDARVALVDDLVDNTELLAAVLRHMCGITGLISFNSGKDFLSSFQRGKYDIVLLDLFMPEISGYTVLESLRKVDPEVPVVAVTAYEKDRQKALDFGFSAFVAKPIIDIGNLCRLVTDFINCSRLKRAA